MMMSSDPVHKQSITLIGMPGVGKSTLGKKLARHLGFQFVDCDVLIHEATGMKLQDYIRDHGDADFLAVEEQVVCAFPPSERLIISSGGSLVYSQKAMAHLRSFSRVVYLQDTLMHITQRISNLETRGIVGLATKTLTELYDERTPLYEKYADRVIDLSCQTMESHLQELELLCR